MTEAQYLAARQKILDQMVQPLDLRGPGGMGATNRSIDDLRKALAALDAAYNVTSVRSTLTQFVRE